jgi:hypothetical protein
MTTPTSTDSDSKPPDSSESSHRSEKSGARELQGSAETAAGLKLVGAASMANASGEAGTGSPRRADSSAESPASASGEGADPSERRGLPIWLFLLVFVLFSGALFWQVRVARDLEGQVAGLEQELAAARSLLGAHRSHLGEIRAGVRDLAAQLTSLQTLVDADPGEERDAATAAERRISPAEGSPAPGGTRSAEDPRPIPSRLPES